MLSVLDIYSVSILSLNLYMYLYWNSRIVSPDFSMKELAKSSTAEKLGIDNTPTPEASAQLSNLVTHVLDPLREMYGKPITVNSGYRCPKLNDAVGGAKNSQHMRGEAADIIKKLFFA